MKQGMSKNTADLTYIAGTEHKMWQAKLCCCLILT